MRPNSTLHSADGPSGGGARPAAITKSAYCAVAFAWALGGIPSAYGDAIPADSESPPLASGSATMRADSPWPELLGGQYTLIDQNQARLVSPYRGPLSLNPAGDTQATHTIGFYGGWAVTRFTQIYLDGEKFMGAGVSNATGLGGLTDGDVVRQGANNLPKRFYVARLYLRALLPFGADVVRVEPAQDQLGGTEPATRLEFKAGLMSAQDDFDRNRYGGSTRTQFMNWSLWANTAWDYAADTRGYTRGAMVGYVSPTWSLRYGVYLMPLYANGQPLELSFARARGENLELTLNSRAGSVLRLLAYRNIARMGDYEEAVAIGAATGRTPDIAANDRDGRRKYGFGVNAEQPLADDGNTGLFARLGWNDGKTESFAFTEVDRLASIGGQLSGVHWARATDRLGVAIAVEGLSAPHREYLAAGGSGFLLGDGRLDYAHEQLIEIYYRYAVPWLPSQFSLGRLRYPLALQLTPDFQYVRNPGFNSDRGPVRFWALRVHLEF